MTTRISDLDSLRHVNNRIYEQFCSEGRSRQLEEHFERFLASLRFEQRGKLDQLAIEFGSLDTETGK
jgi:acyl-CoA thioesterase FadM